MSPPDPPADATSPSVSPRAGAASIVGASLAVLAVLAFTGALAAVPALIAALTVLAAAAAAYGCGAFAAVAAAPAGATANGAGAGPALADFVAAMPMPAAVLDADAVVVAVNAAAGGLVPALRQGEPALLVLRLPAIVDAVRRALATGEPQRAEIFERVPIDRWYEAHAAPIAPGGAVQPLLLLTFHDLTPLRRAEQTRADFVANASHELRTPLAALSGFIDTLQGPARNDTAAREQFLGIMKEQAQRMARLIDDLLSLSRIELNEHIPPQHAVDIVALLRQVVDGLQLLARERDVEVVLDAPAEAMVTGEYDELVRVFENLIENALKYGGTGKRVEVTVLPVPGDGGMVKEVAVSVRDFGPGIALEHLPRLTERFYRVDVSHSRAEGGTGLGLALVKHTVTRHRGRLVIDSEVGKGSTFTVLLPPARPTP